MPIRFITHSRVGMQRAGLLAAAVAAASDRQSADLERVATRLRALTSKRIGVPSSRLRDMEEYLGGLRLWKRYGHLKGTELWPGEPFDVQDLWLADPTVPRATGAVTPENATEFPQLAVSLRLLRGRNHTRTDRGRALLIALGKAADSLTAGTVDLNPLVMPLGARLILLAALIEADGDFLQSVWRKSSALDSEEFTRVDFTSTLHDACLDLMARARKQARTGTDRAVLMRVAEWREAVGKPRASGKDWGGGRPPDQLATVRIEPWVDLGIVTAADRFAYRYCVSREQRGFLRSLAEADDPQELILAKLVTLTLAANGRHVPPEASDDEAWAAIVQAYTTLRSTLGFASFNEVVLVAAGRLADAPSPRVLELSRGVELLTSRRRESPKDVRLGINRAGDLTYMKLSEAARAT